MSDSLVQFRPTEAMRVEAMALMEQKEPEPEHATQVRELSLSLFDQLGERHGLGEGARFVLEAAALLHDIGWSQAPDGRKHHKLAYQMILSHAWETVPGEVVTLIALVARYHRKAVPHRDHEGYGELGAADQEVVRKLAALLRVADALDRSHQSRVIAIAAEAKPGKIAFRLTACHTCGAELALVETKKDLFEDVFRTPLECVVQGR